MDSAGVGRFGASAITRNRSFILLALVRKDSGLLPVISES